MDKKLKQQIIHHKLASKKRGIIVDLSVFSGVEGTLDFIANELANGVEIVELSAHDLPDKIFLEVAQKTKQLCEIYEATLIIQNRADIATLCLADSVNLNQNSVDVISARKIMGNDILIGREILDKSEASVKLDADYTIMPVYSASTEPADRAEIEYAKWVSENNSFPALIRENIRIERLCIRYDLSIKLVED